MKIATYSIFILLILAACDLKGVETGSNNNVDDIEQVDSSENAQANTEEEKLAKEPKEPEKASDTLRLDNGIIITYFKKGTGEKLKKGDMVNIDYRMKLEDGTAYDGNHLVKKPYIPFFVGWNQQTPGWDIALKELRVGDDVDIFLPAKYARGEKGIEGLVPPNANNILSIKIVEKFTPTVEVDDILIWKFDEYAEPGDSIGFKDEVYINYWVSSESKPRYDHNYKRGETFRLVMGDGNIVPGLYKALHFVREGDRVLIYIPAKEAYGSKGLLDLVLPNEDIFYDIQVAKVEKAKS